MTVRRVVLVEVDASPSWSATRFEAELVKLAPSLRPVVFGAISGGEVDAAFRKLRQLARETEEEASLGDRTHSAHKAQSFFRDMFPERFWRWFEIGQPQSQRRRLLETTRRNRT